MCYRTLIRDGVSTRIYSDTIFLIGGGYFDLCLLICIIMCLTYSNDCVSSICFGWSLHDLLHVCLFTYYALHVIIYLIIHDFR